MNDEQSVKSLALVSFDF